MSKFSPSQREEVIVSEHLAELRNRVRFLTWVSGLSWTILVLFSGLLITGFSDWLIHFDDPGLRLVIGSGLLAASIAMAWRQLIRPLIQPLTSSFLATRIEQRFPGLHSRVLSAVEFLQHRMDSRLGSPELQKAVIRDALQDLERIEARDIVETKSVKRVTIAGAIMCVLIGTVVLLHPAEAATSLKRLMFPFANCPWPRQFQLRLVRSDLTPVVQMPDQPLLIARGDTLEMYVVDRRGRLPERVWFEHRSEEDQPVQRESLRQTTLRDDKGRSQQAAVISWVATRGTMEFRATGGDDDTMSFLQVEVVQPPTLESLHVTITPPTYSGRPVESLPQGVGHVQGLLGTTVRAEVTADKPLKSARLRIADKSAIPLEIAADGQSFTATFGITEPGVAGYWFELTGESGFADPEAPRFELRGIADGVPDVVIEDPAADLMVSAEAEVPVKVLAKDDLGLREVRLSYQINDDPTAKLIPLTGSSPDAKGPVLLSTAEHVWKLAEMKLEPGGRITFRAEATDDYNLGTERHVGKSTPRTITIVTKEDKQRELASRVGDLLDDLQQATALQQRARQQTTELQTQLNTTGELRTQDVDQLNRIELDQRQTASRLNRPADGVQSQARQIQEEFRTNKLEDAETGKRLEQIIEQLTRLDREQFPEIESALTRAAKQVDQRSQGNSKSNTDDAPKNSDQKAAEPNAGEKTPETSKRPEGDNKTPETAGPKKEQMPVSSGQPNPEQSPLQTALNDAEKHQSQALETLQGLQDLLSEWRDRRDVSKELNSLIAEQGRIQKESAELGQKTVSKSGAQLSPQEKADLNKMAARQRKMAEQVEAFRKQLQQAADALNERDPDAADRFKDARDELTNDGTTGKLREAAEDIADNQIGAASQVQEQAIQELRDLEKQLKREPTDDIETLVKQIEQSLQEFDTLRKKQLELKDEAQQVAGQPNSPEKNEQLEKLQERQQELGENLAQAERRLERLRLRQPREAAERAQERLDKINKQLQNSETIDDAGDEMQQVADDLEQVERELSLEKRSAQERLAIEELEKIEDRLKALLSQQESVITETIRLEMERVERGSFSRGQLRTLRDLAEVERGLQADAEQMEKSLKVAEVFSLVLNRLGRSLRMAADRLSQKETDEKVVALERDALKKIHSLLVVLQPEEQPEAKAQQEPQQGGTQPEENKEKPEQAGPPGESLPQIAQLKLLKALQEEFLEQTKLLDSLRDKDGHLPADAAAELETLAREQSGLADLMRDMVAKIMQSRPEKPEIDKDGKMKSLKRDELKEPSEDLKDLKDLKPEKETKPLE